MLRSFLWYFLSIRRAERKYEKERRRTAVVPSDNFSALLQPYCMSVKAQTKLICEDYQVFSACFRERSGTKKAFIGVARLKKLYPAYAAATLSRGSMKPPAPVSAEMRCRLTRCTCISQNPTFAPRTACCASNPRF